MVRLTTILDMSSIKNYFARMSRPTPTSVQREIKQRIPFGSSAEEATVALIRTADRLRSLLGSVVEPHGITIQQYNVLRILRGAGARGLPTLEIGERLIERTPGTTRLVDQLVRRGFVARHRETDDRRVVRCVITPDGLGSLKALDKKVRAADRRAMDVLNQRELAQLIGHLDRLRAVLPP